MEDSYSSRQVRSRVVRLMLAAKRNAVEDIRLKGVDKFSIVTFEMARLPAAAAGSWPLTPPSLHRAWRTRAPDGAAAVIETSQSRQNVPAVARGRGRDGV